MSFWTIGQGVSSSMGMIASCFYIAIGLALIVGAYRGKEPFINESEFPATQEELENAKPT